MMITSRKLRFLLSFVVVITLLLLFSKEFPLERLRFFNVTLPEPSIYLISLLLITV